MLFRGASRPQQFASTALSTPEYHYVINVFIFIQQIYYCKIHIRTNIRHIGKSFRIYRILILRCFVILSILLPNKSFFRNVERIEWPIWNIIGVYWLCDKDALPGREAPQRFASTALSTPEYHCSYIRQLKDVYILPANTIFGNGSPQIIHSSISGNEWDIDLSVYRHFILILSTSFLECVERLNYRMFIFVEWREVEMVIATILLHSMIAAIFILDNLKTFIFFLQIIHSSISGNEWDIDLSVYRNFILILSTFFFRMCWEVAKIECLFILLSFNHHFSISILSISIS
jgi:hypothetical protein